VIKVDFKNIDIFLCDLSKIDHVFDILKCSDVYMSCVKPAFRKYGVGEK
jgi:hypothetical protein